MRTIQCLVFLGVTICVGSIRVPEDWNGNNPSQRFRISKPEEVSRQETGLLAENGLGNQFIVPTISHNLFQSNPSEVQYAQPEFKPTMVLEQGGLYILPSTIDKQNTNIRPLQNPSYQDVKLPYQTTFNYKKPQKFLQNNNYNEAYDKYSTLPRDFSRIKPLASGTLLYKPHKEASANQVLQEYNPTIGSVPIQNNKFIVSASNEITTPSFLGFQVNKNAETIHFTTKKEPVFFVTEGYRNVLVQGPNKKKQYIIQSKPETKDETKLLLQKEKLNYDDKIHRHEGKEFDTVGSSKNLVQSNVEKPRRYFESDDRRSRFNNEHLTNNYRDDRLHEPSENFDSERENFDSERENFDSEREDDDKEKISDDIEDEEEPEDTKEKDKISKDKQSHSQETDEEENDEESSDDELEDANESEIEKDEKTPVPYSEHADPKPIPTKPIYPGEGLWAKPGIKHRPHISPHRFLKPIEDEQRPEGHDVFDDLEHFFEKQKDTFDGSFGEKIYNAPTRNPNAPAFSFAQAIKSPNTPNAAIVFDPFHESGLNNYPANIPSPYKNYNRNPDINVSQRRQSRQRNTKEEEPEEDEQDEHSGEKSTEEFVPVRLYSQVRNSEDVSHEPRDPAEHGRLKELIKDTKVQTVYSEEGYEDSAYDHAGHEKKAEKDQGYAEFEKEKQELTNPEARKKKDSEGGHTKNIAVSDKPLTDSIASESIYKSHPKLNYIEDTGSSNNFMTSQESKTTQVKDKNNGDIQLEIQSEVKVVIQPNNSTEAHKYVKIYPKVLKELSARPSNLTENEFNTTESSTTPIIESATKKMSSDKPKVTVKVLDENGALRKLNLTRKKRAVDESFEDVNVDKEFLGFIDKINHTYAPPKAEGIDVEKFPYYNRPELNLNSPLRYAENMQNIPTKRAGELSFYKMADKLACPDVPQDINPLPENVKKSGRRKREIENDNDDEEDEESDEEDEEGDEESVVDKKQPKGPRIQLGDKIDCLKVRYFGENPLDSPFFKEDTVGPVLPIFKDLGSNLNIKENVKSLDNLPKSSDLNGNINHINKASDSNKLNPEDRNKINSLDQSARKPDDNRSNANNNLLFAESIRTSTIIQKSTQPQKRTFGKTKPTPSPVVTLITTPKYTIQLTPNNIYDQIKLLDHLPEDGTEEEVEVTTKRVVETIAQAKKQKKEEHEQIKAKVNKETNYIDNKIETTRESNRKLPNITPKAKRGERKEIIIEVNKKIYRSDKKVETIPENDGEEPKMLRENVHIEEEKNIREPEIIRKVHVEKEKNTREPKMLLREKLQIEEEEKDANDVKNSFSEPEALRRRIRPRRPMFQIFDVSKFLTTTPFPYINSAASTVLPKYKVMSEVFYKDEIKPNEQLNVFADILNNIKNSSRVEILPIQAASDFAEPNAVTVGSLDEHSMIPKIQYPTSVRVKKFQTDSSQEKSTFEDDETTPYKEKDPESFNIQKHFQLNKHSTSTPDYSTNTVNHQQFNNIRSTPTGTIQPTGSTVTKQGNIKILKRRRKPNTTTTVRTTTNIHVPNNQDTPSNHRPYVIDFIEDSEEVLGLVPPQNFQYRTITAEDSNDIPEQDYEYSTLQANTPTESVMKNQPAPVTEPSDEAPAKRPMNKYYFVGLKPPVQQRVRPYSEFNNNHIQINNNLLRRRVAHLGLTRVRRSAARPSYADVSRNRGQQSEGLSKTSASADDIDDYVPHRPKNYHYDEKTGKIIYHNRPAEEKIEEEEVEYEEIPDTSGIYLERAEDATHPTPEKVTTKELLATATPPPEGKGLLDFVVKLKNNPSYKYIPDPTTPKPGSVTTTTEAFATVNPNSTNPPEFLSILSKVKNDKTYKYIDDPKESQSKTKATITTPKVENEEEYDDEEEEDESVSEHIQNSPGGQNQNLGKFQIFDIGDYLPKIKTFTPKTTIDYSKYKTIERPHTRHNISSKYNSEEEKESSSQNDEVVSRPPPEKELVRGEPIVVEDTESVVSNNKGADDASSTTQRIVQLRRGTRPTTQRTTAETAESTESTRRSASRRRPSPSGFRTNRRTTAASDVTEATEQVEKVYPENQSTESSYSDTHDKAKRVYRRRPVRIRHTTERHEEDDAAIDRIVRRSLDSELGDVTEEDLGRKQVENTYQEIKDEIINDDTDKVKFSKSRKREIVEKVPKDSEVINKNYDKSKKHGGNYGRENEEQVSEEQKLLNDKTSEDGSLEDDNNKEATINQNKKDNVEIMNKDYDKKKKHGGNYRKEFEDEYIKVEEDESEKEEISEKRSLEDDNDKKATINENKKDDVETTNKNYDKKKRHGGNYRKEFEDEDDKVEEDESEKEEILEKRSLEDDNDKEATITQNKKDDVEIINKSYDKKKKHGGNYRKEFENKDTRVEEDESEKEQTEAASENKNLEDDNDEEATINQNKKDNVEITNKDYDKKQKHGGNYRKEFEDTEDDSEKSATVVQVESNDRLAKLVDVNQNKKDNIKIINKNYDKKKKHGGNYRKEFEDENTKTGQDESEIAAIVVQVENNKKNENTKDNVEITNKNYDKKKKHGGNYRREFEDTDKNTTVIKHETSNNKDDVELTNKNYEKKKKHGGNYRREFEDDDTEIDLEDSEKVATALEDENKKRLDKSIDEVKKKDVDIINKQYDKTKKHGGNYKSEESIVDELLENFEKLEESQDNSKVATPKSVKYTEEEVKARTSTEQPKRLSDVVPKPDHFYSDPQLPKQINKLGSERPPVKLASEEIDQIAMEGDLNVEIQKPHRPIPSLRRRMFDDDTEEDTNEKNPSTKKPLFIKDPSQRLYFYAPI